MTILGSRSGSQILRTFLPEQTVDLRERRVPLLWVGLPPMKNERVSADATAMNDIYRERIQKAGGVYVDIWEAFVDDANRYSPVGPDVDGQVTRLRANDGVHFTRAVAPPGGRAHARR